MKQNNNSGFSMVIALLLTVVMILLALYILEYIIPYSKNVKSIENSTNAFYQTEGGVEDGLYFFKGRTGASKFNDSSTLFGTTSIENKFETFSSGSIIPPLGEGNSDFDKNFNTISSGNPIQLEVGGLSSTDWNNIEFMFQTPITSSLRVGLMPGTEAIINWQLSSDNKTLNSQGGWILADDLPTGIFSKNIFNSTESNSLGIRFENGQLLNGTAQTFKSFYGTNCTGNNSCILKMSVINELKVIGNKDIPYLEYKIDFASNTLPLRYSRIKAYGKSYGFQKHLEVRVPQQTTNQAFDFTVFQ